MQAMTVSACLAKGATFLSQNLMDLTSEHARGSHTDTRTTSRRHLPVSLPVYKKAIRLTLYTGNLSESSRRIGAELTLICARGQCQ